MLLQFTLRLITIAWKIDHTLFLHKNIYSLRYYNSHRLGDLNHSRNYTIWMALLSLVLQAPSREQYEWTILDAVHTPRERIQYRFSRACNITAPTRIGM